MKKTKKKMEDFLFTENEIHYVEKALYALVDKLKEERLDFRFDSKDEKMISKTMDNCFSKLKLHKNFLIRNDLYEIELSKDNSEPQKPKVKVSSVK
ncbi:MAG: hypothetical protein OEZ36_02980 [Spirochaetota bacterium]|nr:hypothetical protein [Spirochaetota bacterium]